MEQKTRSELANEYLNKFLSEPSSTSIQMFIEDVGDINYRFTNGRTILHHFSGLGYSHKVSLLCKNGADPNIMDDQKQTALCHSIMNRMPDTTKYLLDCGANPLLPKAYWDGFSSAVKLMEVDDEFWNRYLLCRQVFNRIKEIEAIHLDSKPASKRTLHKIE